MPALFNIMRSLCDPKVLPAQPEAARALRFHARHSLLDLPPGVALGTFGGPGCRMGSLRSEGQDLGYPRCMVLEG